MKTQQELLEDILNININIVTCGNCGKTMLCNTNDTEIECTLCEYKSEPCDFPDVIFY